MAPNDLIYIDKIPAELRKDFFIKLCAIAQLLGVNPNWLMQVFKAESGVSPSRRNTYSPFYKAGKLDGYATGFIQFIPSTARALGTTTWDLEKMGYIKQLDYVYKYLKPYTGKLKNYFDVYLVVFFPAAIAHSNDDSWIFEVKNISRSAVAKANPAIDINKNGVITMAEFKQYIKNTVQKSLWGKVFDNVKTTFNAATEVIKDNPVKSGGVAIAALLLLALGIGMAGGSKK